MAVAVAVFVAVEVDVLVGCGVKDSAASTVWKTAVSASSGETSSFPPKSTSQLVSDKVKIINNRIVIFVFMG